MRARILLLTITLALAAIPPSQAQDKAAQDNAGPDQPPSPPAGPVMTVNQLMRGLFFPHSNVVFSPQLKDPAEIKLASEPSMATDPLNGVFGQWEAVENSALVLIEAADQLLTPGRTCSNGRPAPVDASDWKAMTAAVKSAAKFSFDAAKTKSIDKMYEAAEVLNNSCAACHGRYRRGNRCQ